MFQKIPIFFFKKNCSLKITFQEKFNVYTNDIISIQVTKIVHISRKKMILISAQCHIPPLPSIPSQEKQKQKSTSNGLQAFLSPINLNNSFTFVRPKWIELNLQLETIKSKCNHNISTRFEPTLVKLAMTRLIASSFLITFFHHRCN